MQRVRLWCKFPLESCAAGCASRAPTAATRHDALEWVALQVDRMYVLNKMSEEDALASILRRRFERAVSAAAATAMATEPRHRRRRGRRRTATPLVALEPLPPPPPSTTARSAAATKMVDFCFENPLDGCFKAHPLVRSLLSTHNPHVKFKGTSYCHYDFQYRKRTALISSISSLNPTPPCPSPACAHYKLHGHHAAQVVDGTQCERNSIPPQLVDEILRAWTSTYAGRAREFLVIDLFAGWGSMKKRAAESWPNVHVYANDIVDREGVDLNLDLSYDTATRVRLVLTFALLRHWPDAKPVHGVFEWLAEQRIAVLFHCSTPCRTYSVDGLATHRFANGRPKTDTAAADDRMNSELVCLFAAVCF